MYHILCYCIPDVQKQRNQKILFMSNEMSEEDLRNCLLTTVVNNKEFQALHGIKRNKPEKEIVLGVCNLVAVAAFP